MSASASNAAAADFVRASRNWFIIGLIVRGLLMTVLILASRHFLPQPKSFHIPAREIPLFEGSDEASVTFPTQHFTTDEPWLTLIEAMPLWGTWAAANTVAMLLIGLRMRRLVRRYKSGGSISGWSSTCMLEIVWAHTLLAMVAVAACVLLKIQAGPYWIALWGLLTAVWALGRYLLRRQPRKILGLAIEGPATGPRAEDLRQFIISKGGSDVGLELLACDDTCGYVRAAYVSRRGIHTIYLTANMLELMDERELHTIVAHELGHYLHRGRARGVVVDFALHLAGMFLVVELSFPDRFGGRGWSEGVHGAPFVLMYAWLLTVLLGPIRLALSRRAERLANAMALEITADPAAFVSAMTKLAQSNAVSGEPSLLDKLVFQTHPSLGQVMDQAKCYAQSHDIALDEQDTGKKARNGVC